VWHTEKWRLALQMIEEMTGPGGWGVLEEVTAADGASRWWQLMRAMAITPPSGWSWRPAAGGTWSRSRAPQARILARLAAGRMAPQAGEPPDYWLSDLPADTPIAGLVRLAKIWWRIEHDYRELKTGLGLGHFEGRSFTGWHRHVTLAALAQAFCTMIRTDPKAPAPG
jgi:SRSO17 transposase